MKPVIDIGEEDIIGCASNRNIESAILILGSKNFRRLPITKLGKIEGILTITDIFDVISKVGILEAFKERIDTWMTTKPKVCDLNSSIPDAIDVMNSHNIGSLLLVDPENPEMCKGIVTERDILFHYECDHWKNITLKDIEQEYLTEGFCMIDYAASLVDAINVMTMNKTHRIIVKSKEGDGIYGLLSANDITKLITEEREEIANNSNFLTSITAGYVSSGKMMTVNHDVTLLAAVKLMRKENFGALPVMGVDGKIIGLFSERSLLHYIGKHKC